MKTIQAAFTSMMLLGTMFSMTSCLNISDTKSMFSDTYTSVDHPIKDFEKIEIVGSPTIYYNQGKDYAVTVKGPDNLVGKILVEKNGNRLTVRNKGKMGIVNFQFEDEDELAVYVTSPDLIGIHVNGSGDFISDGRIDTDEMSISLRGSGDIDIPDLICDKCDVELTGSGDVEIKRLEAQQVSGRVIGSGDLSLNLRHVDETNLTLKGSGDINADFGKGCRKVDCELHGSGDISLSGQIGHFSIQKHGSGDVNTAKLIVEK